MPRIRIIDINECNLLSLGVLAKVLSDSSTKIDTSPSCVLVDHTVKKCPRDFPCADAVLMEQRLSLDITGLDLFQRQHDCGCKCPSHCKALMADGLTEDEFLQVLEIEVEYIQKPISYEKFKSWLSRFDQAPNY